MSIWRYEWIWKLFPQAGRRPVSRAESEYEEIGPARDRIGGLLIVIFVIVIIVTVVIINKVILLFVVIIIIIIIIIIITIIIIIIIIIILLIIIINSGGGSQTAALPPSPPCDLCGNPNPFVRCRFVLGWWLCFCIETQFQILAAIPELWHDFKSDEDDEGIRMQQMSTHPFPASVLTKTSALPVMKCKQSNLITIYKSTTTIILVMIMIIITRHHKHPNSSESINPPPQSSWSQASRSWSSS